MQSGVIVSEYAVHEVATVCRWLFFLLQIFSDRPFNFILASTCPFPPRIPNFNVSVSLQFYSDSPPCFFFFSYRLLFCFASICVFGEYYFSPRVEMASFNCAERPCAAYFSGREGENLQPRGRRLCAHKNVAACVSYLWLDVANKKSYLFHWLCRCLVRRFVFVLFGLSLVLGHACLKIRVEWIGCIRRYWH